MGAQGFNLLIDTAAGIGFHLSGHYDSHPHKRILLYYGRIIFRCPFFDM